MERAIVIIISHLGCLVRFRRPRRNQNLGTRRRTIRKEYTEHDGVYSIILIFLKIYVIFTNFMINYAYVCYE